MEPIARDEAHSPPEIGHCIGCGYDLRGLAERRCPECGLVFGEAQEDVKRQVALQISATRHALIAMSGGCAASMGYSAMMNYDSLLHPAFQHLGLILLVAASVLCILGVVVATRWYWQALQRVAARAALNADGERMASDPNLLRLDAPKSHALLSMVGTVAVLVLWLPAFLYVWLWLAPAAAPMVYMELRRLRALVLSPVGAHPAAKDTHVKLRRYWLAGHVLAGVGLVCWLGCVLDLIR